MSDNAKHLAGEMMHCAISNDSSIYMPREVDIQVERSKSDGKAGVYERATTTSRCDVKTNATCKTWRRKCEDDKPVRGWESTTKGNE